MGKDISCKEQPAESWSGYTDGRKNTFYNKKEIKRDILS